MHCKDTMVPLRGEVLLRVLDLQGRCLYRHHNKNTITYLAPLVLMDLLTQTDFDATELDIGSSHPADEDRGFDSAVDTVPNPQRNAIRYMRVGTDNEPAVRADKDLSAPVAGADGGVLITSISYPTNSSIKFVGLFGADIANVDDPIQEISLWTRGTASSLVADAIENLSRMFARQAHPPVTKTDAIQLEYTWTIFLT